MRKSGLLFAFCQRTWHWAYLVFTMSTLKKTTTKVNFLQYDIYVKTLCTTLYLSLHLNVSPTVNAMTFIKDISESNYKIIKRQRFGLWSSVYFLKAVQFQQFLTLKLLLLWCIFSKFYTSLSKQAKVYIPTATQ